MNYIIGMELKWKAVLKYKKIETRKKELVNNCVSDVILNK